MFYGLGSGSVSPGVLSVKNFQYKDSPIDSQMSDRMLPGQNDLGVECIVEIAPTLYDD